MTFTNYLRFHHYLAPQFKMSNVFILNSLKTIAKKEKILNAICCDCIQWNLFCKITFELEIC